MSAQGKGWRMLGFGLRLLFAAAVLVVASRLVPWHSVALIMSRAKPSWLAAALLACLLGAPVAALQWRLFLPHSVSPSWGAVFQVTTLTSTARTLLPFLGGDAVSLGLLRSRLSLRTSDALIVLGLDQIFSGIGKAALVLASLAVAPSFGHPAAAACLLAAIALVLLLLRSALQRDALARALPSALRNSRIAGFASALSSRLKTFRDPPRLVGAIVLAMVKKSIEVWAAFAVQKAFGLNLPPWSALLAVMATNLAAIAPGLPAGLGAFEAAIVFVYCALGVPAHLAIGVALSQHAIFLLPDIGYGLVVTVVTGQPLRVPLRDRERTERPQAELQPVLKSQK